MGSAEPVPAHCASYSTYTELLKVCLNIAKQKSVDPIARLLTGFKEMLEARDLSVYCRAHVEYKVSTFSIRMLLIVYYGLFFYLLYCIIC
jgi:hypothetical protein